MAQPAFIAGPGCSVCCTSNKVVIVSCLDKWHVAKGDEEAFLFSEIKCPTAGGTALSLRIFAVVHNQQIVAVQVLDGFFHFVSLVSGHKHRVQACKQGFLDRMMDQRLPLIGEQQFLSFAS